MIIETILLSTHNLILFGKRAWKDSEKTCVFNQEMQQSQIADQPMHAYQTVRCSTAGWLRKTIWVSSGWDFEELKR